MAVPRRQFSHQRHEPLSALPALRAKRGVTTTEIAAQLGVSRTAISDWENGKTDPGSRHLRGLALILGCSVADLLNGRTPPSRLSAWVERWQEVTPLYGTVHLRFRGGGGYDYPLSSAAKAELIYALKSRGRVTWFGFDVYDGRLVFLNCSELESLSLAPRGVAQPYVKREEHVLVETADGKRLYLDHSEETFELVSLLLTVTEEPEAVVDVEFMNDWVVCLGSDLSSELLHHRLGALKLIEVPLEPYREAVTCLLRGQ